MSWAEGEMNSAHSVSANWQLSVCATIVQKKQWDASIFLYFQDCTFVSAWLENTRKLEDGSWDSLSLNKKRGSLNRILMRYYRREISDKLVNQDYACGKIKEMWTAF